jgi:hypothetical protein
MRLRREGWPGATSCGVGLPDNFIEYLPSLLNQAIQHYSCFISYSRWMTSSPIASMAISK